MLTRTQAVADQLRKAILEGELAPGTKLEEIPLGHRLRVSRTPVRAALAILRSEGLLTYVPKRGFEVRRFSADMVLDVYRVRMVLEAHAASECAARGLDAEQLALLDAAVAKGDRILSKRRLDPADLPAYRDMNERIHGAIIRGSSSSLTEKLVEQTRYIPLASDRIILWHDYWLIQRSHDDHRRLVDAIRKRQPERAGALMREHVYFMSEVVRDYFSSRQEPHPVGVGTTPLL